MTISELLGSKRLSGVAYCVTSLLLILTLLTAPRGLERETWGRWQIVFAWSFFGVLVLLSILLAVQLRTPGAEGSAGRWGAGPYSNATIAFLACVALLDLNFFGGVCLTTLQSTPSPSLLLLDIVVASFLLSVILIFYSVRIKVLLDERPDTQGRDGRRLSEDSRRAWEFGHLITLEIGMALFVAGFMSLTYELFLRKFAEDRAEVMHERHMLESELRAEERHQRHLVESERSVFKALFGYGVDEKVLKRIYTAIAASKFTRKACALDFEFDNLTDDEARKAGKQAADLVSVLVTVSYEIHNNTDAPAIYPPDGGVTAGGGGWNPYFENSVQLDEKLDQFLRYSIKGCGKGGDGLVGEREWDCPDRVETVYDDEATGVRRLLKVGRIKVLPGSPTVVRYCYKVYKRLSDSHVWISTAPLTGIDVDVHDHTSKGLRFHVETVGEGDASRGDRSEDHHVWHDDLGMLPNQGFILYWFRPPAGTPTDPGPGKPSGAEHRAVGFGS